MAWDEAGEGLPVVLLHAFPLNRAMWAPQREALSGKFRLVTPDLRGFGQSGIGEGESTMELLADDVHALLLELRLDRVVLGGLSMGGYVTFAFYRKFPRAVQGLILADTRAQADSEEARQGRFEIASLAEREGVTAVTEHLLPKLLGESTLEGKPEVVERVRAMILEAPPAGVARALRGMAARPDSTPLLGQIQCPALVLVGAEDKLAPLAEAESMARAIPLARFETIPAAGHLSNLEQPVAFSAALENFLVETLGRVNW